MLFKITEKDIREDNNDIDSVYSFNGVRSHVLKYIFLMWDLDSPYRDIFDPKIRKLSVGKNKYIGWTTVNSIDASLRREHKFKAAEKAFKDIMEESDVDKILLETYNEQLSQWITLIKKKTKTDKEKEQVRQIMKDMKGMIETRDQLREVISKRYGKKIQVDDISSGDDQKSALERYNERKRE